jgi:hypothetical protein
VAVFVDDKSSYRMPPEVPFLNDTVTNLLAYMPELGAPCDTYILDDITTAPAYKLYIFPPCPDLTQAEREAILRLRATGAALVFMGPAGVAQYNPERNEVAPVANGQSALMGFEATGAEWQVQSKVAWVGDRRPTVDELRAIAKAAGVHIYSDSGDTFYAGNGIVSLHAKEAGEKIIRLPGEVSTREVFASDTPLECEGTEIRATMLAKETRTFTVTPK